MCPVPGGGNNSSIMNVALTLMLLFRLLPSRAHFLTVRTNGSSDSLTLLSRLLGEGNFPRASRKKDGKSSVLPSAAFSKKVNWNLTKTWSRLFSLILWERERRRKSIRISPHNERTTSGLGAYLKASKWMTLFLFFTHKHFLIREIGETHLHKSILWLPRVSEWLAH